MVLPAGGAQTDAAGRYQFLSLAPDTYFIAAYPPPAERVAPGPGQETPQPRSLVTYYPNAADLSGAAPVSVGQGVQVHGVDVRLRRAVALVVRGTLDRTSGMRIAAWPVGAPVWATPPRLAKLNEKDGSFEFNGLEPGRYRLLAADQDGTRYADLEIEITDHDVSDVRLVAKGTFSVSGRLILEDQQKVSLDGVAVILNPMDGLPTWRAQGWSTEDGEFTIYGVVPGNYSVWVPRVPELILECSPSPVLSPV